MPIIFAVATDERTLVVFESEAAAVASCEGLDVEAAGWLFWDEKGDPLQPEFITPNKRGLFVAANGTYHLVKADPLHHAELLEALEHIAAVEGPPPLDSVAGIQRHVALVRADAQ
jgi:hypothetical protein